jgi:subtilase family serine protease
VETTIAESKDSNNCFVYEIPLPDLVISDAAPGTPDSSSPSYNLAFEVTVENIGEAVSSVVEIPVYVDGVLADSHIYLDSTTDLASGASNTITVNFYAPGGSEEFEFCAENIGLLESDESNNCFELAL